MQCDTTEGCFELSQVLPSKLEEVLPMVEQLEQLLEDHDIADEL